MYSPIQLRSLCSHIVLRALTIMINDRDSRMMILLFERGDCGIEVGRWLGDNGFVARKANDVCHAIEELSDFTVRRRPDVVMLEVARLPQRIDELTNALHECSDNVCVCGYAPAANGRQG